MQAPPDAGYLGGRDGINNGTSSEKEMRDVAASVAPRQNSQPHLQPRILGVHDNTHAAYNTAYNSNPNYQYPTNEMSLYEPHQSFPSYPPTMMHDPNQDQEDNMQHHPRYPTPPIPTSDQQYHAQAIEAAAALEIQGLEELQEFRQQKDDSEPPSPGRSKPIPKPDREVTKGDDGRFICTWNGCTEDIKEFNRKCEWSKHMDKHDRPYKCPADGCEKLPGFTYSGGLLRHQREVHNLHGGPRKQLNCPHPTCKRFSGKGFSRQENLNEHLRRVHTDGSEVLLQNAVLNIVNNHNNHNGNGEDTEEEGGERAGMKRKRGLMDELDGNEIREEMARLRNENEELKKLSMDMQQQIVQLQNMIGGGFGQQQHQQPHQAPQASMM